MALSIDDSHLMKMKSGREKKNSISEWELSELERETEREIYSQ